MITIIFHFNSELLNSDFYSYSCLRNKKKTSLDDLLKTTQKDLKRFSNLIVKGNFKDIVSPIDRTNNYQKLVKYNKKVFEYSLRNTLNTTIQDIGRLALEVPKNITKNLICFKPYVLRFWRLRQGKQKRMKAEEQLIKSMRSVGKMKNKPKKFYSLLN